MKLIIHFSKKKLGATCARTCLHMPTENWPIRRARVFHVHVQRVHAATYGSPCHNIKALAYLYIVAYKPQVLMKMCSCRDIRCACCGIETQKFKILVSTINLQKFITICTSLRKNHKNIS